MDDVRGHDAAADHDDAARRPRTSSAPARTSRAASSPAITATTFSSTESRLNLCSDGRFVEDVETYSDFGPPTHYRYEGRWEVVQACVHRRRRERARAPAQPDGSEGFVDFVAQGGKVFTNGREVSVQASGVCT